MPECEDCTEHSGVEQRLTGLSIAALVPKVSMKLFIPVMTMVVLFILGLLGFQNIILSRINSVDKSNAVMQIQIEHVQKDLGSIQTSLDRVEDALK